MFRYWMICCAVFASAITVGCLGEETWDLHFEEEGDAEAEPEETGGRDTYDGPTPASDAGVPDNTGGVMNSTGGVASNSGGTGNVPETACQPGEPAACACSTVTGQRICVPNGSGFGPCQCPEVPTNGDVDLDGDRYSANASDPAYRDCNDSDPRAWAPSAPEYCDGHDNNCNGEVDEGCPEQPAENAGTGGASSSGGASSTGGTATSTGGNASSTGGDSSSSTGGMPSSTGGVVAAAGAESTGGAENASPFVMCEAHITRDTGDWPAHVFSYFTGDSPPYVEDSEHRYCNVSGQHLICRFMVDRGVDWHWYVSVGSGEYYLPGGYGPDDTPTSYDAVEMSCEGTSGPAHFGFKRNKEDTGYDFVLYANNGDSGISDDRDNDGVPNDSDCDDYNPTVRPPLVDADREICGNGEEMDEDCSGIGDACGGIGSYVRHLRFDILHSGAGVSFATDLSPVSLTLQEPVSLKVDNCRQELVPDPLVGQSVEGYRCETDVDRGLELNFQEQVGENTWLAGYECVGSCSCSDAVDCPERKPVLSLRTYVYDDGSPVAAADNGRAGWSVSITPNLSPDKNTAYASMPSTWP